MGLFLRNSGFEDIVYQAGICTSGSLCGVMSGSHYNRAFRVHETICEVLERLLLRRFVNEVQPVIDERLNDLASSDPATVTTNKIEIFRGLLDEFESFKQRVRGKF